MKELILYIHGKGGNAAEADHYRPLFPDCEVIGLDYHTSSPWEAGEEIHTAVEKLKPGYESITLIVNSIGAYFSMNANIDEMILSAYFISPIIDMEQLICSLMLRENVTEAELENQGTISTSSGEDLSWNYLCYVRNSPIKWNVPTHILYGKNDILTSQASVAAFAKAHHSHLTVMENGEHWFHTEEQMLFLDNWIRTCQSDSFYEGRKMIHHDIIIRRETENDYRAVEDLVREAFWNVYRPGCLEHYVLHRLRSDPAFVPELDFVMEKNGRLIGQNVFVRAVIKADSGKSIPIMTMGPICIAPDFKRQGYGKMLLDYTLEKALEAGCGALCFEGNIDFYGKSGFRYASTFGIRYHDLPEDADSSFFLCRELIPGYLNGITGVYAPPEGYFAAEREKEAFERFDAQFPPKEKLKLPGQIF